MYVTILCEEDVIQMLRRKFFSVSISLRYLFGVAPVSAHSEHAIRTHDASMIDLDFANREKLTRKESMAREWPPPVGPFISHLSDCTTALFLLLLLA